MSVDQINQDLNVALKSGDKPRAEALRLLKSALINARIANGHEVNEDEFVKVVRKEIKSRVEARDMYSQNNRSEQAAQEEYERSVYAEYIPAELSDEAITKIIEEVILEVGDSANFGTIMSAVMQKTAGQADGKRVSNIIKESIDR